MSAEWSPMSKRLCLEKNAALFYLGFTPFKILTTVPNKQVLLPEDLPQTLPSLREGEFCHLNCVKEGEDELSIYIYKFTNVKGCRTIHSEYHGQLPPSVETGRMSDKKLLSYKGPGKLGTSYYYTSDEPTVTYTETGGYKIEGNPCTSSMFGEGRVEVIRGARFKETLKAHLTEHLDNIMIVSTADVKLFSGIQRISPFSGGGDDMLVGIPLEALVVAEQDEEEKEENGSPIKKGEHRSSSEFEYKDLTSQSNEAVQSQLDANMMLIASQLLVRRLKNLHKSDKPITTLRTLNTVVSYGTSFGIVKPIVIKKITLDLINQTITLSLKYESQKDIDKAPRLACATQYIIERMWRPRTTN